MKEKVIPKIEVKKGSITNLQVNAIVNPANSCGQMGGGVAGVLKKVGGQIIEDEAVEQAPIQIGEARMTTSGDLPAGHIIHAPTRHNPVEKTDEHKVLCAVSAALELADEKEMKSIAIPGMGTGVGGLDKRKAAEMIVKAIKETEFKSVERIILVDIDEQMVSAFEEAVKL